MVILLELIRLKLAKGTFTDVDNSDYDSANETFLLELISISTETLQA